MRENAATLEWVAVATLDDLWEGEITDVQVGDEHILLAHLEGGAIRAYQGYCPHQRTPLADGKVDGYMLACAAHLWQFNLCTGEGVNPKGCRLYRYETRVEDGTIFVRVARAEQGETSCKEYSPQNL